VKIAGLIVREMSFWMLLAIFSITFNLKANVSQGSYDFIVCTFGFSKLSKFKTDLFLELSGKDSQAVFQAKISTHS
jgi:hypothetical protein